MLLKNKVAIVTGGSRGIGRAIVVKLAQEGADVAFTYSKSAQEADSLVKEVEAIGSRCLAVQADARDFDKARDLIEEVKERFGKLDILVNNAGITKDKALMMMAKQDWFDVIDTNLNGTFNATRAAIVTFLKQRSGDIINITSVSGVAGLARQTNYSASKAGIIGFTKALAKEVAGYNVRVNAVAPGFVETDIIAELKEDYKKELIEKIPLGRFGKPEEIAGLVVFLLSDAANFITGQTIVIDGGLFIQ